MIVSADIQRWGMVLQTGIFGVEGLVLIERCYHGSGLGVDSDAVGIRVWGSLRFGGLEGGVVLGGWRAVEN